MRILFLSPHYGTLGGVRIIVDAIARAALADGHAVGFVVDGDVDAAPAPGAVVPLYPFPARAVVIRRLRRFTKRFPGTAVRLVRAVRAFAPDVVSVHCVRRFAPYAALVRRTTGVPQVLSLQEAALPPDVPENRRLFRLLVRAADVVAACSRESAEYARSVGGAADVRIVPNGYEPAEFGPGPALDNPRPYVYGVGRLETQKGFDVLVQALARLARRDVDVVLAGDGSARASLEALVRRDGVADRVRFLGATDRPTTVAGYRGAAVVACPSRFEGLPLVCLEAFAAGKPVVATSVNGIPEVVRDGETGLLVPPDDPAALAAALDRVLAAPAESAAMAARGRALVEREHAWPVVTRQYLALCEGLAAVGRAARAAAG